MEKTRVEVLSVEKKDGISHKSGSPKPWEMRNAHSVIYLPEGKQVGVIRIPKGMPDPAPGFYDAEFGLAIDFQTREVRGVLVGLIPAAAPGAISDAYVTGADVKPAAGTGQKKAA